MPKKVILGISGGVDSSVCALLLKQNPDYSIELLFMRNWDSNVNNDILGNKSNDLICPQEQDYNDAKNIAEHLGLKIHRVDFSKEYWDMVFTNFLTEYQNGRTPNPDILCNKFIKFDAFLKYAKTKLHADYIAMGHYAKVQYIPEVKEFQLLKPKDTNKDQTYFLSQLNQSQLSQTIFPLANLTKEEVRKIALDNNLLTANKKDSTGICFIGERDFQLFLENYIPNQPGNVIDINTKKIIGQHIGVMYYTIGQRKGLNLSGFEHPYFVVGKDMENKILYVANSENEHYLLSDKCKVTNVNWINNNLNQFKNIRVKFRYRQKDINIELEIIDQNSVWVKYPQRAKSVSPGQQAVFYSGDVCLGGGVIDTIYLNNKKITFI